MAKRNKIATWFLDGPVVAEKRSEPLEGVIPPAYSSSPSVTTQSALSVSAIYSAVNIITTWVAQMDLSVQRAGEEITPPSIIAQPNTDASLHAFLRSTVASLAISGDAFWLVSYNAAGVPNNVSVLNPFAVLVKVNDNGVKTFELNTNKGQKTYSARQVKHIMTTEIPGRVRGLGVIEANSAGIAASLELRKYADNWFSGSGVPKGGYLKSDQVIHPEVLPEVRNRWLSQMNDGLPPAMGQGFDYVSVNLNPAEAMFLEQQQFAITEIARWFGIPAGLMLADSGATGLTYQNLSTDARLFVTNTLMRYMMPIQDAFSALLPRGQVVKFKTEALLRGDTQERYEAYKTAIEAGFMTVNEVRAAEGWAPINAPTIPKEVAPATQLND